MSALTSFSLHVDWRVTALTNSGSADVPGLAFERSGSFRLGLLEPEPPWNKEIQPVHSEDQPWDFFGRNDAKAETPVLWPPHAKS